MEDLQVILSSHNSSVLAHSDSDPEKKVTSPSDSKIPDLFFDEILVEYKLTRVETLVLMYLYRITWCKPNLHVKFGIAPILSHKELAAKLNIDFEALLSAINKLEGYEFIETIRSGQYFVRKYFTAINDKKYGQNYDNFL
ncbi:MAG: hypothetical protein N4A33_05105 [Bacteriovoracaceae bacterium]|jgi:DNA-binding MarR family transcriptional regulator|nr:hypothetical protein [Bacteriovoracaceae bacterium]